MADDVDIQALARRYLDLWERQVAESATDPTASRALAQWLALITAAGETNGAGDGPGPTDGEALADD